MVDLRSFLGRMVVTWCFLEVFQSVVDEHLPNEQTLDCSPALARKVHLATFALELRLDP